MENVATPTPEKPHRVVPLKSSPKKKKVENSEPLARSTSPTRLMRKQEVMDRCGIKASSTLYSMIQVSNFPAPIHINGGRAAYWVEAEIEAYIADALASAGRGGK